MDRTVPDLFANLDDYLSALGDAQARAAAGLSVQRTPSQIAADFPAYARAESFAAVREEHAHPSLEPRKKDRLDYLWPFLARQLVDAAGRGADEARQSFERIAHAALPDEQLPFPEALQRAASDRQRERRAAIERQLSSLLFDHQSAYARRVEAAIGTARSLGFPSYRALVEATSGQPLQPLVESAELALARTEDAYRDLLAHFLKKVDAKVRPLPQGTAQRHDLWRLGTLDAPFTKADLWPVARRWLDELGLAPTAEGRISVHVDGGAASSAATAVQVPRTIRLAIHSTAGVGPWTSAFSAIGRAQHLAGAGDALPPERRWLGDPAHLEATGDAFARLLHDEAWLRRYLGLGQAESREAARLGAFLRLARLREVCAATAYELSLYERGPSESVADEFVSLHRAALFVEIPKGFFLKEVSPHLGCAVQLRAFAADAALNRELQSRFDADHWRNPAARAFLAQRFARGQVARVDDVDVASAADLLVAVMSR